ncbi:MAG: TonB-dependent receptor [Bacteroidales bacterium]
MKLFYKILPCIAVLPMLAATGAVTAQTTDTTQVKQNYLDQLVVTGTKTRRALKDVPVITRLITAEEIKRESPRSLSDLLETELPGLEFTRTEGVSNSITFQGMGANYLLILIDGERMAGETQRSNPDFNRIDIDNVERIEIVKGAMSTLYGSGAVAGVINIITKGASKPFQAGIEGLYSGEGEQRAGINLGAKTKGGFSTYTSAVANFKQNYFFDDTEIEGFKNVSVTQKLGYSAPGKFKLDARAGFYAHERFNAGLVGKLIHDIYYDWNLLLKGEYEINAKNKIEVSYNFDDYSKYARYLKLEENERNYRDIIHNPKVFFSTDAIRRNTLVAGVEFLHEGLQSYQFGDSTRSVSQVAAFVQDDYRISNRFSVQAGVRLDYNDRYNGVHVTPKISVMYKLQSWSFRAGYAAGFRAPTLKELYTTWDHQGMFELIGNPNLKPEKSHNVQASVEYTKGKVNVSVNGFYNYIYDKISTVWNVAQDTSFYSNIDHSRIYGADVNLRMQLLDNFAIKAGYAYVNDRQLVEGHNTSATRPHSATMRLEYNFQAWKCPITLGLNGRWLSSVDTWSQMDNNEYAQTHYQGYSIWKINAVGRLPYGIRVNMGIQNLFNYKPSVVTYNAGITRGITFFCGISIALDEMFAKNSP